MSRMVRSLAAAALVAGCEHPLESLNDGPRDPAPQDSLSQVGSAASRSPESSGRVVRFRTGFFAFLNFDETTNLQSVIGLPDDPSTTGVPFCGGSGDFEVLDWHQVLHPDGAANTLIKAGSVNVHVYDGTAFGAVLQTGDLCAAITLPRLAEGRARLQYTDNDFDVVGPRANSFGWRLHGELDDLAAGGSMRYLDRLHGVLRPTGAFDFTVAEVRLTQIN